MTVNDPDELWPGADGERQESPEDAEVRASMEAAFEEFYVHHKERIENYVRNLLYRSKCPSAATHFEDVAGDGFARARKSLHAFKEDKGSLLNWIFAILRNQVYDHVHGPCSREVSLECLTRPAEDTGRIHFAEPRAPLEDLDKLIWLNDRLDRMPEKYGQILRLVGYGHDFNEIAKIMGITAINARQLCLKARRMLKAED